jgi:hypothetical protein
MRNEKNPRFETLGERCNTQDSLGPTAAGSNPIRVREGDPAAPPLAGDNPRVVRMGHDKGHHRKPARWRRPHPQVNVPCQ